MKPRRGLKKYFRNNFKMPDRKIWPYWFTYDFPTRQKYPLENLKKLTEGDYGYVVRAFEWDQTPQGRQHWNGKQTIAEAFTEEDKLYFEWLYEEFVERGYT